MQEAEIGISNNERACFSGGLANHLAYVQQAWVKRLLCHRMDSTA